MSSWPSIEFIWFAIDDDWWNISSIVTLCWTCTVSSRSTSKIVRQSSHAHSDPLGRVGHQTWYWMFVEKQVTSRRCCSCCAWNSLLQLFDDLSMISLIRQSMTSSSMMFIESFLHHDDLISEANHICDKGEESNDLSESLLREKLSWFQHSEKLCRLVTNHLSVISAKYHKWNGDFNNSTVAEHQWNLSCRSIIFEILWILFMFNKNTWLSMFFWCLVVLMLSSNCRGLKLYFKTHREPEERNRRCWLRWEMYKLNEGEDYTPMEVGGRRTCVTW